MGRLGGRCIDVLEFHQIQSLTEYPQDWTKHTTKYMGLKPKRIKDQLQRGQQFDFPGGSDGKASAYKAGDPGSIPGLGRSPGEGNGNPLQYSCLENPMDGGTW